MQEDWGELNVGKKPPSLFVLDLKRCNVKPVTGLPADSSIGQPEWTPDGQCIHKLVMKLSLLSVVAPDFYWCIKSNIAGAFVRTLA